MKKNGLILGSMLLASSIGAGSAMATELSLQQILNGITVGGASSVNATTDYLGATKDSTWSITATGGSVATMIIELAGYAPSNIFGVYDSKDSSKMVNLFAGSATAGSQVTLAIKVDGSVFVNYVDSGINFAGNSFGYYLNSPGGLFYSNSALNSDSKDHMVAYQGTGDLVQLPGYFPGTWTANEFILGFEDVSAGSDWDYNDLVAMVESVQPVPEPATMLLFGSGLLGLASFGSRRRSRNNG